MLNEAVNRVANGRRLQARRIVMVTLASIPVQVWRKRVVYDNQQNQAEPASLLSFEALQLSKQDEPNYEYDYVGPAYMLMDKFNGGYIHKNNSMNNPADVAVLAQIELYDDQLASKDEQIFTIPDSILQEGDLIAMGVYADFMLWYEVVGMTGQALMADFGTKYILNRRDELHIDPIKTEVENRP